MTELKYYTEPPETISQKPVADLRYLLRMKKTVPLKLDPIIQLHRTRLKRIQTIEVELGSPKNSYITKKIENIFIPFSPKSSQKLKKITSRYQTIQSQFFEKPLKKATASIRSKTHPIFEQKNQSRAIMRNEQQRIDRLLKKHKEKEQNYSLISKSLKIKSQLNVIDPRIENPLHMKEKTWYKKWFQSSVKEKHRVLQKRYRTFQLKLKRQRSQSMNIRDLLKINQ